MASASSNSSAAALNSSPRLSPLSPANISSTVTSAHPSVHPLKDDLMTSPASSELNGFNLPNATPTLKVAKTLPVSAHTTGDKNMRSPQGAVDDADSTANDEGADSQLQPLSAEDKARLKAERKAREAVKKAAKAEERKKAEEEKARADEAKKKAKLDKKQKFKDQQKKPEENIPKTIPEQNEHVIEESGRKSDACSPVTAPATGLTSGPTPQKQQKKGNGGGGAKGGESSKANANGEGKVKVAANANGNGDNNSSAASNEKETAQKKPRERTANGGAEGAAGGNVKGNVNAEGKNGKILKNVSGESSHKESPASSASTSPLHTPRKERLDREKERIGVLHIDEKSQQPMSAALPSLSLSASEKKSSTPPMSLANAPPRLPGGLNKVESSSKLYGALTSPPETPANALRANHLQSPSAQLNFGEVPMPTSMDRMFSESNNTSQLRTFVREDYEPRQLYHDKIPKNSDSAGGVPDNVIAVRKAVQESTDVGIHAPGGRMKQRRPQAAEISMASLTPTVTFEGDNDPVSRNNNGSIQSKMRQRRTLIPFKTLLPRSLIQDAVHDLRHTLAANILVLVCSVTSIVMHGYVNTFESFVILNSMLSFLNSLFGIALCLNERDLAKQRLRRPLKNAEMTRTISLDMSSNSAALRKSVASRSPTNYILNQLHFFLNLSLFVLFMVTFIMQFIFWSAVEFSKTMITESYHYGLIAITGITFLALGYAVLSNMLFAFYPVYRFARSVLFLSAFSNLSTCVTMVVVNTRIVFQPSAHPSEPNWVLELVQWAGIFMVAYSMNGLSLCWIIRGGERAVFNRLITMNTIFGGLSVLIMVITAGCMLGNYINATTHHTTEDNVVTADLVCSLLSCVLAIISTKCVPHLQTPPPSGLKVERVQLSDQPEARLKHWAKLIDLHGAYDQPDPWGGDAAISLMKAYEKHGLIGGRFMVLRVSKPRQKQQPTHGGNRGSYYLRGSYFQNNEDLTAQYLKNDKDFRASPLLAPVSPSGTPRGPQLGGDFLKAPGAATTKAAPIGGDLAANASKMTKAQLKRLEKKTGKKAAKKAAKAGGDPEAARAEAAAKMAEMKANLVTEDYREDDDTEALVMLTIIEDYDLTNALKGRFQRFVRKFLGSESIFGLPLLVVRMGLIGVHWPFKTCVLFTSATSHPITRAAHVLKSITEWNDSQSPLNRCSVLLLPSYVTETLSKAVPLSGFFRQQFPPSHVIDLRPYHARNQDWSDFLKGMKRGNRRDFGAAFTSAGGTVEIINDFDESKRQPTDTSPSPTDELLRLWKNIASLRTEVKEETATLFKPSKEYLQHLSEDNAHGYRSLMFLKLDGEIIASCVLFKFPPSLITSDMQGLEHSKARKVKAYFAMMQEVIKIAIAEKINFVDFGPTTTQPKQDVGCRQVPLHGGAYSRSVILEWGMKMMAGAYIQQQKGSKAKANDKGDKNQNKEKEKDDEKENENDDDKEKEKDGSDEKNHPVTATKDGPSPATSRPHSPQPQPPLFTHIAIEIDEKKI